MVEKMKKYSRAELLEKELLLKVYSRVSVFIGFILLLVLAVYFNRFPDEMFGTIENGLFNITLAVTYDTSLLIFNTPLVVFLVVFLFNLGVLIYAITGKKVLLPQIVESILYNTILSFLFIVSQVVLYFVIPATVNGAINFGFFSYNFSVLTNEVLSGINFGYILITIYTFYNMFIVYFIRSSKEIQFKKEEN